MTFNSSSRILLTGGTGSFGKAFIAGIHSGVETEADDQWSV